MTIDEQEVMYMIIAERMDDRNIKFLYKYDIMKPQSYVRLVMRRIDAHERCSSMNTNWSVY